MSWKLEHTDTISGEANYCWANRETLPDRDYTDRQLVIRAKRFAGFTGMRCDVCNWGDGMQITPKQSEGVCQTVFVTWEDAR